VFSMGFEGRKRVENQTKMRGAATAAVSGDGGCLLFAVLFYFQISLSAPETGSHSSETNVLHRNFRGWSPALLKTTQKTCRS